MIFVSLAYVLVASAQQLPASTWNQSLFLLPHYNSPLAMAPPKDLAAYQMPGNEKQVPVYTTVSNTLGSHIVLLSTCLRELKSKSQ
jgi:hypothetical protein